MPRKAKAVPADLEALRQLAAVEDAPFFCDCAYGELKLDEEPEGVIHYASTADGETWKALFKDVVWIGSEADSGLIGYFARGCKALDEAPVFILDSEGELRLTGRTLLEHLALRCRESGKAPEALHAFCDRTGLPRPPAAAEVEAALAKCESPQERLRELKAASAGKKAKGKAKKALVRPVGRHVISVRLPDARVVALSPEDDVARCYEAVVGFLYDPQSCGFESIEPSSVQFFLDGRPAGTLGDQRAVFVALKEDGVIPFFFDAQARTWVVGKRNEGQFASGACAGLQDGRLLVAGGRGQSYQDKGTPRATLYDPASDSWTDTGPMSHGRTDLAMVALPDGGAIALGGGGHGNEVERWDHESGTWRPLDGFPAPITHTPLALPLSSGEIVVVAPNQYHPPAVTRFLPKDGTWTKPVACPAKNGALVELADGRVAYFAERTVHELTTEGATALGSTLLPRNAHTTATLMPDGRVLLVGGDLFNNIASEPELWDPESGQGTALPGLEKPLEKQQASLVKFLSKKK